MHTQTFSLVMRHGAIVHIAPKSRHECIKDLQLRELQYIIRCYDGYYGKLSFCHNVACNRLITNDNEREIKIKKIEDCQIEQHEMHDKPDARLAKPEGHAPRFLSILK